MAWNLQAIEQTPLRDDVASMAWGVRSLISTQAGRDLPALRDARRAGEAVGERVAAFYLEHLFHYLISCRYTRSRLSAEAVEERVAAF